MDVQSTVFEKSCEFINGVGGCTTIVGSRHGGAVANTPTPTLITSSSATSTHASPTLSQTPNPASLSPTRSLPSSTSSSANPSAVASPDPPRSDTSTSRSSNTSSVPSLTSNPGTATNVTSTITGALNSATAIPEPNASDTNTSAANSFSAIPSTLSPSPSTSFLPLSPPSASGSHLPAAAIAAIAIGAGAILLVLLVGCIGYAARRRRLPPTVVRSSTSGASDASILSRETSTTRNTLLPIEHETGKLEFSLRNSSETLRGSTHVDRSESMVVEASNFEPDERSRRPLSRALETVPFLAAPSPSGKGVREAATTGTAGPASMEAITAAQQSTAEMEDRARTHCDLWTEDADGDGEDVEGRGRTLRYETDAGIRLDDGLPGELRYADDDQRTIASMVTAPPPYSRY